MEAREIVLTFGKFINHKLSQVPDRYLKGLYESKILTDMRIIRYIERKILKMPCEKKGYLSRKEAMYDINKIKYVDQNHKKPIRAYKCEYCEMWHLTSMSKEAYQNSLTGTELTIK